MTLLFSFFLPVFLSLVSLKGTTILNSFLIFWSAQVFQFSHIMLKSRNLDLHIQRTCGVCTLDPGSPYFVCFSSTSMFPCKYLNFIILYTEWYSIVDKYHIYFVQQSLHGHFLTCEDDSNKQGCTGNPIVEYRVFGVPTQGVDRWIKWYLYS